MPTDAGSEVEIDELSALRSGGRPGSVLLCGDIHSTADTAAQASAAAAALGCEVVLQVGDLGWRPGDPSSVEMCEAIAAGGVPWVFADGDHDHLGELAATAATHRLRHTGRDFDPDPDGLWGPAAPIPIAPMLWWAARGARWTWGGSRFGALGGAWSPGWHYRQRGWRWFPRETISRRDLDALGDEPLDVLVCHDVPDRALVGEGSRFARRGDTQIGEANSAQVRAAVCRTGPRLVVHGHWHLAHSSLLDVGRECPIEVVGLAANGEPGSLAVLDPVRLQVRPAEPAAAGAPQL